MKKEATIITSALRTINLEAAAIQQLGEQLGEEFEKAIQLFHQCTGRIVLSGIGKSAIVAQKIVATLNSTGTPAIFLHAGDAIHGDLGMVQQNDVVVIISKSGESPEIKVLVPLIKNSGNTLVAMVGNLNSYLSKKADCILNTTVYQEACPNNLAPTTSTTAQMVMGDAIAVCLMELKGFDSDAFARFHPGGALGKKLYLRVSDLYINNEKPQVFADQSLREAIMEISEKRLGITAVIEGDQLVGIITDGDLRRLLEKEVDLKKVLAKEVMTANPKTILPTAMAVDALDCMRQYEIMQLAVVENGRYFGIVHLHDLVREGLL
ncbi:MAG: D-arabinose 5-phosphate isomerase [Chitinophagaceae bacterium]